MRWMDDRGDGSRPGRVPLGCGLSLLLTIQRPGSREVCEESPRFVHPAGTEQVALPVVRILHQELRGPSLGSRRTVVDLIGDPVENNHH